jgi:hypothetical protein
LQIKKVRATRGPRTIGGKKSRFDCAYGRARLRERACNGDTHSRIIPDVFRNARQEASDTRQHRGDEVTSSSISYLPATFTTLFFLAASLLLGLMR